jgi:anti-sigma factor RsiW
VTDQSQPELTCRELVELVTDYLEDRLARQDRARFEVHLAECEYCATYVEQMGQTIRTLGRLPEESLSPEARDALLEAFRHWPAADTRPL